MLDKRGRRIGFFLDLGTFLVALMIASFSTIISFLVYGFWLWDFRQFVYDRLYYGYWKRDDDGDDDYGGHNFPPPTGGRMA